MREIVFDTETTGLDPNKGDRLVEIGCVELLNLIPTGQTFQAYINPERDMPPEAFAVHGLSREFLADKPLFHQTVDSFLEFIGDAKLVAHNADFDLKFLNSELLRAGREAISRDRVIDTLVLARRKHPGATNSLDALCTRYRVDTSRRTKHGALLDSEILAEVYAELCGGRQTTMSLSSHNAPREVLNYQLPHTTRETMLASTIAEGEIEAHQVFVESLGPKALWMSHLGLKGAGISSG